MAVMGFLVGYGASVHAQFEFGAPENLGPEVNNWNAQFSPSVSADDLQIYFSSGATLNPAGGDGDLYVMTREVVDGPWGPAEGLGPEVNSPAYEGEPSISTDGLSLYFSDGNFVTAFPRRPGGLGLADIWLTTRDATDGEWDTPLNLGEPVNSRNIDSGPSISADGLSLYFGSDRPGGSGQMDLWVAKRDDVRDSWEAPENLGSVVNSSAHDMDPEISDDGRFLFFSSLRSTNLGYMDIYVTTRAKVSDPWGPAVNLGRDLNTQNGEWTPALSSDGSTLFFAHWHTSSEPARGGFGQLDLWQVPMSVPPMPDFTMTHETDEAPLEVRVDGSVSTTVEGHSIDRYEWDFGDGAAAEGLAAAHTYTRSGRFPIALTVTDDRGLSWTTARPVSVGCAAGDISPWQSADVGEPLIPGSARIETESGQGRLSLCATGKALSGAEDSFHFVFQELSGDTTLTARITNMDGGLNGAQVGVMLRESLAPDAPYAAMTLRREASSEGSRFNYRESKGERSKRTSGPGDLATPNVWVRIERQGGTLVGSVSTDGSTWEEVDRRTINGLSGEYYGGVFAAGAEPRDGRPFEALRAQVHLESPPSSVTFVRGDCTGDGEVNISDATCALGRLFAGGAATACLAALNTNGDGDVNIADPVLLLNFLFGGGPHPTAPFPDCGPGTLPADADLGCANPPDCQ